MCATWASALFSSLGSPFVRHRLACEGEAETLVQPQVAIVFDGVAYSKAYGQYVLVDSVLHVREQAWAFGDDFEAALAPLLPDIARFNEAYSHVNLCVHFHRSLTGLDLTTSGLQHGRRDFCDALNNCVLALLRGSSE